MINRRVAPLLEARILVRVSGSPQAQFIHDVPVQLLAGASMRLQLAVAEGEVETELARQASAEISRAVAALRVLIADLSAPVAAGPGLESALDETGVRIDGKLAGVSDEAAAAIVSAARILVGAGAIVRARRDAEAIVLDADRAPAVDAATLARLVVESAGGRLEIRPDGAVAGIPATRE
jgi:hypothetical protein